MENIKGLFETWFDNQSAYGWHDVRELEINMGKSLSKIDLNLDPYDPQEKFFEAYEEYLENKGIEDFCQRHDIKTTHELKELLHRGYR